MIIDSDQQCKTQGSLIVGCRAIGSLSAAMGNWENGDLNQTGKTMQHLMMNPRSISHMICFRRSTVEWSALGHHKGSSSLQREHKLVCV
eukprot:3855900-Amphidinium_carterae.2